MPSLQLAEKSADIHRFVGGSAHPLSDIIRRESEFVNNWQKTRDERHLPLHSVLSVTTQESLRIKLPESHTDMYAERAGLLG